MRPRIAAILGLVMTIGTVAIAAPPSPIRWPQASPPTPKAGATTAKRLDEEIKIFQKQGYVLTKYHRAFNPDGSLKTYFFRMHKPSPVTGGRGQALKHPSQQTVEVSVNLVEKKTTIDLDEKTPQPKAK